MAEAVCPWWLGYFLANPLRGIMHDPARILGPYVAENMKVADIGCGMGFFSLPMAQMVGADGRVVCIDLQEQMIAALQRRAAKKGLSDRVEARVCSAASLRLEDWAGTIDFALTFAVIHEIPDGKGALRQIHQALQKGGRLLIAEPSSHVPRDSFDLTVAAAREVGFQVKEYLEIKSSYSILLEA